MRERKISETTVCVLFGGVSTEYFISLRSAYNVIGSLRSAGYRVIRVGIKPDGRWLLFSGSDEKIPDGSWENNSQNLNGPASPKTGFPGGGSSVRDFITAAAGELPDIIFPVIHGINCEDGTVQGLLELSGIPYVGCNVTASALGMDKMLSRRIFKSAGIPVCRTVAASRDRIRDDMPALKREISRKLGFPCFIKPNSSGSSVGTCRVDSEAGLEEALAKASEYDHLTLIEEWIPAREIEIAVLGNEEPMISAPGEILTAEGVEYYDYNTKYIDQGTSSVCLPARLIPDTENKIRRYAVKAYKLLGCSGMARVDFFIDKRTGQVILNEINTIPGFTSISLYPKAWEASGVSAERLVTMLCGYAVSYKESHKRMEKI